MKSIIKKPFILLFCLFIAINAYAIDESVFEERYSNFEDYQSLALQGLKNYFGTLFSKGVMIPGQKNSYVLRVQNDSGAIIGDIFFKIERSRSENILSETVHLILPADEHFDYAFIRHGTDLAETSDEELLTFNFKTTALSYELVLTQLATRFIKQTKDDSTEKAYIFLGMMEVNTLIETNVKENEASRNYIFFYNGMPNPQFMLSVRGLRDSSVNHNLNFIHSMAGTEVSPQYFFQGLDDFAQIYTEFSRLSLSVLMNLGFPRIKGIN